MSIYRRFVYKGKNEEGEIKNGTLDVKNEEELKAELEKPPYNLSEVEFDDLGPVGYYGLNPDRDCIVPITQENYWDLQENDKFNLTCYPTDKGRVWDLESPDTSPEILHAVYQAITGMERSEDPRPPNNGPQISYMKVSPEAMARMLGQASQPQPTPNQVKFERLFLLHQSIQTALIVSMEKGNLQVTQRLLKRYDDLTNLLVKATGEQ
jgi:hypothetical protein